MKSFFIADILGETSTKEKTIESCDECNTQSEKEGKRPSAKTRGDRKYDNSNESNCLPSWRRKFTDGQTNRLEEIFLRQKYITGKERTEIAKKLGLTTKQVKTWFQNRRTKWKREKQRNSYTGEFFRQDGLYALTEDFKRTVDDFVHCCELPTAVAVDNWGCYVMSGSLPVPVIVDDHRRL